jgi:hypothetical protein
VNEISRTPTEANPTAEDLGKLLLNVEAALDLRGLPVQTLQQAAFVSWEFARKLRRRDAPLIVWRICARILGRSGLSFEMSPDALDEFYGLAAAPSDSPSDELLDWITKRVQKRDRMSRNERNKPKRGLN